MKLDISEKGKTFHLEMDKEKAKMLKLLLRGFFSFSHQVLRIKMFKKVLVI